MTRDRAPSAGVSASAADRLPGDRGSHPTGKGRRTAVRRRELLTLVAMCLGVMMTFLLVTGTISALTAIQDDLHVSPGALVWIPSAYTLVVAALVLPAGTLGNLLGRKRMFCVGVVIMTAGGVLAATGDTTVTVIAAQLVSGVGGALVLPNSLAVLGAAFTDPQRRTEVITVWAASSGIGLAVGPLLAGVLLNHFTWHAVFVSNPVIGVITLLVAVPFAAESRAPDGRLDVAGALLGTVTIASLVYALIQGGQDGYTARAVITAWVAAAVGAVVFVAVELRVAAPMLDVRLFASRSFSAVMAVAAVSLFGFTGVAVLVVMFYNNVQHLNALDTSRRMLPLFGVYVVTAFLTGRMIRRTGFKAPLTAGLLLGALAVLGLTTVGADTPYHHVWPLFALFGASSGLVIAPSTAAALVSVAPERAGMASGAVNTARQVGAVMGTALLGSLLAGRVTADLPRRLAAHGIPAPARAPVERAVASGTTSTTAPPGAARAAIEDAFTSGVHTGLAVTAAVFLAAAVLALTAVHPHSHHHSHHLMKGLLMDLSTSTVLVTGANRGLGRALAAELLNRGATVYAGARNPDQVDLPGVRPIALDITDPASVTAAAKATGDVTVLINNAGISTGSDLLTGDMNNIRRDMDTNFYGTLSMARAFAPQIAAGGGGAILNILSALSWFSFPEAGAYCAAKSAQWSLTNALRLQLADQGIRVAGLHVAYMDTDMTSKVTAPKTAPADVARLAADGLAEGAYEIVVDDISRQVQAGLAAGVTALYPQLP